MQDTGLKAAPLGGAEELRLLVEDLKAVRSAAAKDLLAGAILARVCPEEDAKAGGEKAGAAAKAAVPVYFDLLTSAFLHGDDPAKASGGQRVVEHYYSPAKPRIDVPGLESVIRVYDRQNNVVYENAELAPMCPNYAERLRKAEKEVYKAIGAGKAGLTTEFGAKSPEYATPPEYSKEEIDSVRTETVDPRNPLSMTRKELKAAEKELKAISESANAPRKRPAKGKAKKAGAKRGRK